MNPTITGRNGLTFWGRRTSAGTPRYVNCGCMVLKTETNGYLQKAVGIMEEIGCPYEHLDADQVRERLPVVALDSFAPAKRPEHPDFAQSNGGVIEGAMFFSAGGYVTDPQLASHNLERAAQAAGAQFRFNARVEEILTEGGRVSGVRLAGGDTIAAPVVVNVAGPHSYKINEMAGVTAGMNINTRALRHEVAHVPSPEGYDFESKGCVMSDNDTTAYIRPETGNHILIGSEDPECDPREWVDPDDFDRDFSDQVRILAMRAAQRIPDLPIPNQMKGVVELYDVSDDWIPIYDKSDLPGFYMAVGTSGNQFKNAPIVGEMMADLVEACEAGHDHDVEPVTFRLKHIDREITLGFYSRRREINADSSFSVLG